MSGGKGGKAPAAPDYLKLAQTQGDINADAARLGTQLSRVNQVTPYGSVTYRQVGAQPGTQTPSRPSIPQTPSGPQAQSFGGGIYGNLMAEALRGRIPSQTGTPAPSRPAATGSDQWEQVTTLSPEQQRLFNQNQSNQIGVGQAAASRLGQIAGQGPLDFSGQPSQVTGVNPSQFRTDVSSPGTAVSSLDFTGLNKIPGANDFSGERQRVEDALYGRATSNLDPQFQQREDAMRTRLLNSGIREGSEAWNTETGNFGRERENAYTGARESAILAGGNEQSRLMADALRARQQGAGEVTAAGQFGNQAANQALQAELAKLGLYNAAEGDEFAQGLTNAQLQNMGRSAGINEEMMLRNQPLQEFLSLFGGAQPNVPNAQPGGSQPVSPYDLMGAANQSYDSQLQAYNARQQQQSGLLGGLMGLGGSLGGAAILASDERLKEDIEPVGELPQGVGVYEYAYKDDPNSARRIGVLAQEVERVQPDAVLEGRDGFKRVDYRKVLSRALRAA